MSDPQAPAPKLPFVTPSVAAFSAEKPSGSEEFSILDLTDPVVIMLLFQELVREEQVREAWERWRKSRDGQPKPLWRVLVEVEGVQSWECLCYGCRGIWLPCGSHSAWGGAGVLEEH